MNGQVSSVALEVFDPTGMLEATQAYAPRLADLSGKTICELSDSTWEDYRTFPRIRELLQKRYPDLKIIPYTDFPSMMDVKSEVLAELIKEKGCQGAIVGNAA